jgi:hypothetical protein
MKYTLKDACENAGIEYHEKVPDEIPKWVKNHKRRKKFKILISIDTEIKLFFLYLKEKIKNGINRISKRS